MSQQLEDGRVAFEFNVNSQFMDNSWLGTQIHGPMEVLSPVEVSALFAAHAKDILKQSGINPGLAVLTKVQVIHSVQ